MEEAFQATKMGELYGYRQDTIGSVAAAHQSRGGLETKVDILADQVAQLLKCNNGSDKMQQQNNLSESV